jgi:hypothetical protein
MRALLFLITASFVFGPRLQLLDIHMAVSLGLATLGLLWLLTDEIAWSNGLGDVLVAQFPVLLYSIFLSMLFGSADVTIAWIVFKGLLYLLAAYAIVALHSRSSLEPGLDIFRSIFWIAVINAAFVIAVVIYAPLRQFAAGVLVLDGKEAWIETGFRGFDFSMGGGASASIVFAILFISGLHGSSRLGSAWVVTPALAIVLLATVLTGRTGVVLSVVGFVAVASQSLLTGGRSKTLSVVAILVAIGLSLGVFVALSDLPMIIQIREVVLPWAFEGLIQSQPGSGGNRSLNAIVDGMYFLPSDDLSLIFGTSNAGRSDSMVYIESDVGYIRLVFGIGFMGLLLLMWSFVPMFLGALRYRHRSMFSFPVLVSLLAICIANAKEMFLSHRAGGAILALWFVAMVVLEKESIVYSSSKNTGDPAIERQAVV